MCRKKSPVLWSVAIAIVLIGLLFSGMSSPDPIMVAQADASVSAFRGQFIAKMYTEALGRAPTPTEWQSWIDYFQVPTHTCSTAVLREVVEDFYTSQEFNDLGYDRAAALLALFRGALNREPDEEGFLYYYSGDGATLSWPDMVHHFLYVDEAPPLNYATQFNDLVTDSFRGICKDVGDPPFYETAPYGWDEWQPKHPVLDIRDLAYAQPSRTQAELQNDLYAAGAGGVVELLPMETIMVNTPLVPLIIPRGVTLKTQGNPLPSHYARMGRLVRIRTDVDDEKWPLVILQTGGTLSGVWVDGQRGKIGGNLRYESMNVLIQDDGDPPPGTQTRLTTSRLTDSIGGSLIQVQGAAEWWTCGDVYVGANLFTGYANRHPHDPEPLARLWADGIAAPCAHTTIEGNIFVDISDVGVVLFRGGPDIVQSSVVRNNVLLNAGNSAFGALGADPFYPDPCDPQNVQEYDSAAPASKTM